MAWFPSKRNQGGLGLACSRRVDFLPALSACTCRLYRPTAAAQPLNMLQLCVLVSLLVSGCAGLRQDDPQAAALAKKHGRVAVVDNHVTMVALDDAKGVREVLPVLDRLPKLRALHISGVPLTENDLQQIGELNLTELRLGQCGLGDSDLRALANLTNLERLNLIHNPISDAGLKYLCGMTALKSLTLSATNIRGPGLASIEQLHDLEQLFLTNSRLDDSAMLHCTKFRKLRRLDFGDTSVTNAGLMQLANLHWLNTIGASDGITDEGMIRFRKAHTAAKKKARAAGVKVPPDWQGPFGGIEYRYSRSRANQ